MSGHRKGLCQSCDVEMVRDSAINGVVCPQCGAVGDDSVLVQHVFDRRTQELQGLLFCLFAFCARITIRCCLVWRVFADHIRVEMDL